MTLAFKQQAKLFKHSGNFALSQERRDLVLNAQSMMAGGRSSQILKVRQYNPSIRHIKEKQKVSALAKCHAFIAEK